MVISDHDIDVEKIVQKDQNYSEIDFIEEINNDVIVNKNVVKVLVGKVDFQLNYKQEKVVKAVKKVKEKKKVTVVKVDIYNIYQKEKNEVVY